MLIFFVTLILVSLVIIIGRNAVNRRPVADTLSKPPEYMASLLLGTRLADSIGQVEESIGRTDFVIISKDQNSLILNDNKITKSGPAYVTQPDDVIYKIEFSSQPSGQTEVKLSATEKSHFLSASAITVERFAAFKNQIAQIFGVTPPKVNDLVHQKSTGARAGDFLVVLLIAIVVIGGIILAAYLLYGRS